MPFTASVERLFRQHGIRIVAIFPDGHVGQPRSRHIRSTRKDETTTEHLTGARGPGDETKRLIADRLEATGDANLGLDREVGARHRGENEPRLRDGAAAWVDEGVCGGTPRPGSERLELIAAGRFENNTVTVVSGRRRCGLRAE